MNRQLHPLDVTFDEVKDLQCPNCNGYRVEDDTSAPLFFALNLLMTISTYGLWLLIWLPLRFTKANFSSPPKEIKVKCKLCGYRWIYKLQ